MGEASVQNVTPRILTFIPRSERWLKDSTPVAHHKPVAYFLTIETIPAHIIFLFLDLPFLLFFLLMNMNQQPKAAHLP